MKKLLLILCTMLILNSSGYALTIAVASDFENTFKKLQPIFEKKYHITLDPSFSSTAILYNQIAQGAPVDIFLSADKYHIDLLKEKGEVIPNTCVVYAKGSLVLYKPNSHISKKGLTVLLSYDVQRIAIANPTLAPYGKAAKEVLSSAKLWQSLKPKLVMGENIGQCAAFVLSKNADMGFLAYSQLLSVKNKINVSDYYVIPQTMYHPIVQYAAIMIDSKNLKKSYIFMHFLAGDTAKKIIRSDGYQL